MITTTRSPKLDRSQPAMRRSSSGFSLVEIMIAASVGSMLLAAVLSSFLFIGRSGWAIQSYNDMETQARRALEFFAQDTRQASSVTWNNNTSVTLVVDAQQITYTCTAGTLTRTTAGDVTNLVTGITSFSFLAYTINGTQLSDFSTAAARLAANSTTKQIQVSLSASRNRQTAKEATNTVLSARFILRNKRVTA